MTEHFDVQGFVDDVKAARTDGHSAVDEVLERALAEPSQVLAGLGEPARAGLDVLYHSPELTILNVVWAPSMVLLPHDHKMWASIGIYTGREDNIVWKRSGNSIEATRATALREKQVFALGESAIHSVINPIPRRTGAIHVYGGDYFKPGRSEWDAETLVERPFDVEALRETFRRANEHDDH